MSIQVTNNWVLETGNNLLGVNQSASSLSCFLKVVSTNLHAGYIVNSLAGFGPPELRVLGPSPSTSLFATLAPAAGASWTLTPNIVYHIAVSYAYTGSCTVYVNGVSIGSAATTGNTSSGSAQPLTIGYTSSPGEFQIENVAIWNGYALSSSDVLGLRNATLTPATVSTPATSWWTLTGTPGGTPTIGDAGLQDSGSGGNNLTTIAGTGGSAVYAGTLTYTPILTTQAYLGKVGKLVNFFAVVNATGRVANITAVNSNPTIKWNGSTVTTYGPVWQNTSLDAPFVTYYLPVGTVNGISIPSGGSSYVTPVANFSGGGGSGAACTLTQVGGVVTSYTMTSNGSGYTGAPTITITDSGGSGSGATAYALMSGASSSDTITYTALANWYSTAVGGPDAVSSAATITNYQGAIEPFSAGGIPIYYPATGSPTPTMPVGNTFEFPPGNNYLSNSPFKNWAKRLGNPFATSATSTVNGGGVGCLATATINGLGHVSAVNVVYNGINYSTAPQVTFSGGGGSGATATANTTGGAVATIKVTAGGSGYTSGATVGFSGGGGSGATATATVVGNIVTAIVVTAGGSGYTSVPTVTVSPVGAGSGATATATLTAGVITSITLNSGGTGYTSAPTVLVGGIASTTDGQPITWNSGLTLHALFANNTLNGLDSKPMPVPLGVWTIVYDDSQAGTGNAMSFWIYSGSAEAGSSVDSQSGPFSVGTRTVVGNTVTIAYNVTRVASPANWSVDLGLGCSSPINTWTASNLWIFAPGNTIDRSNALAVDDNMVRWLTSPVHSYTSHAVRPHQQLSFGSSLSCVDAADLRNVTDFTWSVCPAVGVVVDSYRYYNTDTAKDNVVGDSTYPYAASPNVYFKQFGYSGTDSYGNYIGPLKSSANVAIHGRAGDDGIWMNQGNNNVTGSFNQSCAIEFHTSTPHPFRSGDVVGISTRGTFAPTDWPMMAWNGSAMMSDGTISVGNSGAVPLYVTGPNTFVMDLANSKGDGKLKICVVNAGGSGYTSGATVGFSGGGGSGATATATVSSGVVTAITVTGQGSGYTSAPTVTISPVSGGSGATATAYITLGSYHHVDTTSSTAPVTISGTLIVSRSIPDEGVIPPEFLAAMSKQLGSMAWLENWFPMTDACLTTIAQRMQPYLGSLPTVVTWLNEPWNLVPQQGYGSVIGLSQLMQYITSGTAIGTYYKTTGAKLGSYPAQGDDYIVALRNAQVHDIYASVLGESNIIRAFPCQLEDATHSGNIISFINGSVSGRTTTPMVCSQIHIAPYILGPTNSAIASAYTPAGGNFSPDMIAEFMRTYVRYSTTNWNYFSGNFASVETYTGPTTMPHTSNPYPGMVPKAGGGYLPSMAAYEMSPQTLMPSAAAMGYVSQTDITQRLAVFHDVFYSPEYLYLTYAVYQLCQGGNPYVAGSGLAFACQEDIGSGWAGAGAGSSNHQPWSMTVWALQQPGKALPGINAATTQYTTSPDGGVHNYYSAGITPAVPQQYSSMQGGATTSVVTAYDYANDSVSLAAWQAWADVANAPASSPPPPPPPPSPPPPSSTVSMSAAPVRIPVNATNVTLTLTGVNTAWLAGTTVFTTSGVSATDGAQNVLGPTSATIVVTTGAQVGRLTVSDGSESTVVRVGNPNASWFPQLSRLARGR
jgi:hypothetical protein